MTIHSLNHSVAYALSTSSAPVAIGGHVARAADSPAMGDASTPWAPAQAPVASSAGAHRSQARGDTDERGSRAPGEQGSRARFAPREVHDLRTPLTTILGYCELLVKEQSARVPDGNASLIESLLETGYHITTLVDGNAGPSRMGAGSDRRETLMACWSYVGHIHATLALVTVADGRPSEEHGRYLSRVRDAATRLERVVASLLAGR